MGNGELVPFRINVPPTLEPIGMSVVPDCGRSEYRALKTRLEEIRSDLDRIPFRCHMGALALWAVSLFFLLPYLQDAGVSFGYAFLMMMTTVIVSHAPAFMVTKILDAKSPRRLMRSNAEQLEAQIAGLDSMERVTQAMKHATELESEVWSFDIGIKQLSSKAMNDHDRARILERRRTLMDRIGTLQQETLPASDTPEPKILPPYDVR
jgi:hypothetical protein